MGANYEKFSINKVTTLIKRGISPKYTESDGLTVVNQRCIRNQTVNWDNTRQNDTSKKAVPKDRYLQKYDVLVNSTGIGTLGRVAQVTRLPNKSTIDSHVTILRPNDKLIDPYYFGFSIRSIEQYIASMGEGSTGQTELSRTRLGEVEIYMPSISMQRSIAHILGSLDDKIELNRQMNQTLEQMAQALFKSWFIDFDPVVYNAVQAGHPVPECFQKRAEYYRNHPEVMQLPADVLALFPDQFEESELGWIPVGWQYTKVLEEFGVVMGQSPSSKTYNEVGDGLPFFQGRRDFGSRYPHPRVFCSESKKTAMKGDVLISVRAPVGDINMALETCCIGRGVASIRHKDDKKSYTYYSMLALTKLFLSYEGEGTVFGSINKRQLSNLPHLNPQEELVDKFEMIVSHWDKQIENNHNQIKLLSQIRDYLLPKLINGNLIISLDMRNEEKSLERNF